jgi:peptidoglycan L-alanyl-D-glutamate endopeptidase CwlK
MDIKKLNAERLAGLLPEVRELAERHIALCEAEGIELLVTFGCRSLIEQKALYAMGRTAPGKVVTNARPGFSWHNFGRAYDVAVLTDGKPDWTSKRYTRVGELGKSIGLIWGGDFKAVRGDLGHFEYHPNLTLAQARANLTAANAAEDEQMHDA